MKKILFGSLALVFGLTTSFAAYQPTLAEENVVDTAGRALLNIIKTDYAGDYELLHGILQGFTEKVSGDEKKVRILETLIQMTLPKINK